MPERLARYFSEEEGGYRVNKEIREMVVFAPHNIISDPPFTKLDLLPQPGKRPADWRELVPMTVEAYSAAQVDAIDRAVVTDKVNGLDLLQLERLLLSIMEEQFKYINLFGALLGFLIGLGNLALLRLF